MKRRGVLFLLGVGSWWSAGPIALADPMRPSYSVATPQSPAARTAGPYRLQGIIGCPAVRVAIVDGRVVGVGDRLGSARIVAIGSRHVALQAGARRWIAYLPEELSE
ncbi:MAG: hypothetical protein NZM12_02305 [Steroidobacteraceae bacterium]|nr:hypothetical protein [Steroidobacteraceae bacterium]MDW8259805.1 hypothetical protein [Gammaproteobacteria bacterium]